MCGSTCLDLNALHLAACDSCESGYCDADGNLDNGCEINTMADDVNNCGACGQECDGTCSSGTCIKAKRYMVMSNQDVYADASLSSSAGQVAKYTYIKVLDQADGKARAIHNGNTIWISSNALMDACDECIGRPAIDLAETLLYTDTHMCTYDLYKAGLLQNFVDLYSVGGCNLGYDLNCANFVSSMLKTTGLITGSDRLTVVSVINSYCSSARDGYHSITKEQAKPGDIWLCGGDHAEMVLGYHNGTLHLIGSNNFGSNDGTNNCLNGPSTSSSYSTNPRDYQRVSYGTSDYCNKTQYLFSRQ